MRLLPIILIDWEMGSSPSYEVEEGAVRSSVHGAQRSLHKHKDSIRASRNRQKDSSDVNPEQELEANAELPHDSPPSALHETRTPRDEALPPADAPLPLHLQIPAQSAPTNPLSEKQLHESPHTEAQNAEDLQEAHPHAHRHDRHRPTARHDQEEPDLHDHHIHRARHYVRASPQPAEEEPKASGRRAARLSEEIDYREYDSAHIRHKAMQEVAEHGHPVVAREPVYEHERLYPKILKGAHHEGKQHGNTPNRHYQHERNLEQEAYEQPHHLHLYRRHRPHDHDQLQHSNPLQHSLPLHPPELTPRPKANTLQQQQPNRARSLHKQEEPAEQPNFRKRKASMPNDQQHRRVQPEEKSIADLNREREFNVTEYAVNPAELVECREGCGRRFASDRIAKHEAVCRRVFQERRAAYDVQEHRIANKEQRRLLKRSAKGAKEGKEGKEGAKAEGKEGSVSKWRAQSIALRAHIKMGMDSQYQPTAEEEEMLSQEHHIDIVTCPVCERSFNKNAAKTHIPFCKAQLDKQLEKQRFERPKKP